MTFAAFPSEGKPREDGDIIVPFELIVAVETDGTLGREPLGAVGIVMLSASLTTEEGAEAGAKYKKNYIVHDCHGYIVSFFRGKDGYLS